MKQSRNGRASRQWAMVGLVVLIGINLRPFLTAPGPMLADIVADTGLRFSGVAMLTLLPMLLMGAGAFVAPAIEAAVGVRRGLIAALALLMSGSWLRLFATDGLILILTAMMCGAGVAFIQAAFPGIIKTRFPTSVPTVTGLYSAMIMGGGAFGARLMPALASAGYGWRAALAWLAAPVLVALIASCRVLPDAKAVRPDKTVTGSLLRRPRSWALMAAFGLINSGYSSLVAWLAPYYQTQGWTSAESSSLVAIMALCQASSALGLPLLARSSCDRRPWLLFAAAMQVVGFSGLAFFPTQGAWWWAGLCGAGLGGSFSLSIVTALDHLPRPEQAGALAALMQGGGFLIAALGPYAMTVMQDWTGNFSAGWLMHAVSVGVTALIYLRLDPTRYHQAMRSSGADRSGLSGFPT
ncbi:cyanate transporter [Aminobacter sp. Piv2-1]|uniref:cyanate transporter n=1 Tax=Aminobacter sp. Piv2-1 TaxID=3031122 RepID=UPI0030A5CD21